MSEKDGQQYKFILFNGFHQTITAPLNRLQALLQAQKAIDIHDMHGRRYKGATDAIKRIYREQGFRSFWRSNVSSTFFLWNYYVNIIILTRDQFKILNPFSDEKEAGLSMFLLGNKLTGGLAVATSLMIANPFFVSIEKYKCEVGKPESLKIKGAIDAWK